MSDTKKSVGTQYPDDLADQIKKQYPIQSGRWSCKEPTQQSIPREQLPNSVVGETIFAEGEYPPLDRSDFEGVSK